LLLMKHPYEKPVLKDEGSVATVTLQPISN